MNLLNRAIPGYRTIAAVSSAAVLFGLSICAARAADPTVTGPVPGAISLTLGKIDLASLGYTEEEYFLSGQARSFKAGATPADGHWTAQSAESAPYATRIVVIRPTSAKKFNGTAVVEWLNVSLGIDTAADWLMVHRELLRSGYVYVAVSAQKVGVDGGVAASTSTPSPLTKLDPARYGKFSHPGDAYSFDIFSQAGKAVRGSAGVAVLGPLRLQHMIAIGESQSAFYLTTYVNAISPLGSIYDGYFIHSRGGMASTLEGGRLRLEPKAGEGGVRIRTDLKTPVITVLTETDVAGLGYGFYFARQADTELIRAWEIPGTSHADNYIWQVAGMDDGKATTAELARAFAPTQTLLGVTVAPPPINAAPQHHYVLQAALAQLTAWVAKGKLPSASPRLDTDPGASAGAAPTFKLDANGNVKGGIRTPWVDVPTAKLSGLRKDNGVAADKVAALSGSTESFDSATLAKLYPGGRSDYLSKFRVSLARAVSAGFILKSDAPEIEALAEAMYPAP